MGHHSLCAGYVEWATAYVHTGHVIWYDMTSASSARVLVVGSLLYKGMGPRGVSSRVGEVLHQERLAVIFM